MSYDIFYFHLIAVKPFFNKEPTDLTVLTGQTVQFYCSVGGDPQPQIIWRRGKTIYVFLCDPNAHSIKFNILTYTLFYR